MSLSKTQQEFALDIAYLIQHINAVGYSVTFGDAFRDPRSHGMMGVFTAYGRAKSAHKQRLAVDLNLFKDGSYLSDTDSHMRFGAYWKDLHVDNVWGGDFPGKNSDGNHYSRRYGGTA